MTPLEDTFLNDAAPVLERLRAVRESLREVPAPCGAEIDELDDLCARLARIEEPLTSGLSYDGGHHKQFYLAEVARALGIDLSEWDEDDLGMPA